MAKKKQTAQQRDIARLAKDYQSNLMGLEPEYQSAFSEKTKALEGYSAQNTEYQKRLIDFQQALAEYKINPLEKLSIGRGTMASPDAGPNVKIQPNKQYDWRSETMYRIPELGNDYYTPYALEQLGYEISAGVGGGLSEAFKRKTMPTFTEEAISAPDTSESDIKLEQIKAKQKSLGEGYARDVAERKSGRVGAVSQRAQSRPMLSKGVTL
jgi:hypothetical protein